MSAKRESQSSGSGESNSWLNRRRLMCIGLLLLAAVYVVARPGLERWLGMELPALIERGDNVAENDPRTADDEPDRGNTDRESPAGSFELKTVGGDTYQSPAGLIYAPGPGGEHRIDHVMRHAVDAPSRPVHGVFLSNDEDWVLATLDEAWTLAKQGGPGVESEDSRGRTEWTIDLPEPIGFVGGEQGARQNHPKTRRLKLVVEGNRVVTAYPTWPPR